MGGNMKRAAAVAIFFIFSMGVTASAPAGDTKLQSREIVEKCIETMGGLSRLQNVKLISYQSISHAFLRSISISDSLPGLFAYQTDEVVIQPQHQIVADVSHWQWTESATPNVSKLVISPEGGFI